MKSILVISRCAAHPYPAAPDFLHRKACHTILRSLCSLTARLSPTHNILRVTAFLQNMFAGVTRVPLPPHPGDRINRSMLSCRDMAPWLSIHSPTTKWGEGGGASHQRGNAFPRPQGGCKGFIIRGRHLSIKRRPPPPFEPSEPFEPERRRRLNPQARQGLSIRRVNLREYWKAPPRSRIPIPHSPSLIHSYRKIP